MSILNLTTLYYLITFKRSLLNDVAFRLQIFAGAKRLHPDTSEQCSDTAPTLLRHPDTSEQ